MDNVYWLQPDSRELERLNDADLSGFDVVLCPCNAAHSKSQRRRRPLRLFAGVHALADFQWTQYNECIVTEVVRQAFCNAHIDGVRFERVKTYTTSGDEFHGEPIFELRPIGWGGMADQKSGIRLKSRCECCGYSVYSTYSQASKVFSSDAWDGSDVFVIWPLPRYIFVINSVAKFIRENGFTGVVPCPIAQLPKPLPNGTLTPGNLGDWFESDKLPVVL